MLSNKGWIQGKYFNCIYYIISLMISRLATYAWYIQAGRSCRISWTPLSCFLCTVARAFGAPPFNVVCPCAVSQRVRGAGDGAVRSGAAAPDPAVPRAQRQLRHLPPLHRRRPGPHEDREGWCLNGYREDRCLSGVLSQQCVRVGFSQVGSSGRRL